MFVDLYSNLLNLLALHLAISSFADRVIVRHYPAKLPLAVWVLKPETAESSAFRMRIPGKTPKKTPMVFGIHILLFFSINYSENLDVAVAIHKYTHTHMDTHSIYVQYIIYTRIISILTFAERRCKYIPRHGHFHGSEMNLCQNTSDACVVLPQAVQHVDVNEPPHRP